MAEGGKNYLNAIKLVDSNTTTYTREDAVQELRKWEILQNVPEVILRQVRYAFVAPRSDDGCYSDYALMITYDDEAYVIGENRRGQLGIHRNKSNYVEKATKVKELSGLGIIGFSTSSYFVSAWTKDGKLFMMGANSWGQLGQGTTKQLALPRQVLNEINAKVVKAACGHGHTLCLTADGSVYAWGLNDWKQCNPESVESVMKPRLVKFPDDGIKIVNVTSSFDGSYALTANGQLYGWGGNRSGEIGIGSSEEVVSIPTKIAIPNEELVTAISCGYDHCIVLTTAGTLFVWGSNDTDQLGTGNADDARSPVKLNIPDVIRISTTYETSNSICQKLDGSILAWGSLVGSTEIPALINSNSINDCRAEFKLGMSETWVSKYRLITVEPDCLTFITKHADKKKIIFQVDGERIAASKVYMLRCDFFEEKLQGEWKQELKTSGFINIAEFQAKHFKIFINFMQTDRVENTIGNDLIDLLKLAHFYKMERFRSAITNLIKAELATANVIKFYTAALEHKDETLYWEIINFMKQQATEILDKINFTTVEQAVVVKLLTDIQALGAFKSE